MGEGAALLAVAGITDSALDSERLLRHVLGWDRADLITRGSEAVPLPAAELFREAIRQRARRRPLQHLTGIQAFWRHEFLVTPDVLIPRPETELLVEEALRLLRDVPSPVVVDVGTGSGCIALSLAAERPDARVHATDVSAAALRIARANARRLHLESRVRLHEGDLLDPLAPLAGTIDLVVSNPPYVTPDATPGLAPEVRDHEPRAALVPAEGVGPLYARLFRQAASVLRPGGPVVVELGQGQDGEVARLAAEAGLTVTAVRPDLQGIARVLVATRTT